MLHTAMYFQPSKHSRLQRLHGRHAAVQGASTHQSTSTLLHSITCMAFLIRTLAKRKNNIWKNGAQAAVLGIKETQRSGIGAAERRHAEHAPHSAARAPLSQTPAMLVDPPVIRLGVCISPCPSPGREWPGHCTSPVKCPHVARAEPPSHNPQFSNPASRIFDPECQMALQSKQGRPAVKGRTSSCGHGCHLLQPQS